MKVIKAGYEIIDKLDGAEILKKIELCGRVCYKSENRIDEGTAEKFVRGIIKSGHESVLEHFSFTVRFIVDRGVSHELVRHRIASFSQESTRYCNYGHDNEITVIEPSFWIGPYYTFSTGEACYEHWKTSCRQAEKTYLDLLKLGKATPQEARSVLPNSLKTEVIMTANLREWRHFLRLRTAKDAHPQMREVTIPLLADLQDKIPVVFDDIIVKEI
jgi:thymidylate synthase (FAD)